MDGAELIAVLPRYGSATFTRKKRLSAFVGPYEPSVRLSRPSTV